MYLDKFLRSADILISTAVLMLSFPLFIMLFFAVFISMGRPFIFSQVRVGLDGRLFRVLKIRTMNNDAGSDDERLTPVGKFLRRASLDELPQLVNVLKGEMSLVGPRPLPPERFCGVPQNLFILRHSVRPGITGYSQVKGRGYPRDVEEKLKLDIEYVCKKSVRMYLSILFETLFAVLLRFYNNKKGESL